MLYSTFFLHIFASFGPFFTPPPLFPPLSAFVSRVIKTCFLFPSFFTISPKRKREKKAPPPPTLDGKKRELRKNAFFWKIPYSGFPCTFDCAAIIQIRKPYFFHTKWEIMPPPMSQNLRKKAFDANTGRNSPLHCPHIFFHFLLFSATTIQLGFPTKQKARGEKKKKRFFCEKTFPRHEQRGGKGES